MRVDRPADEDAALNAPAGRRAGRLWLLAPLVLAGLVVAGWSAFWFIAAGRVGDALDEAAAAHRSQGRTLAWEQRSIEGFPFRMKVVLDGVRFASPSGWAVKAPRLEAQATAYRLGHWVGVAPQGITVVRPQAGPVKIEGRVLRASLSGLDQPVPRFALEGVGLTFTPGPGAQPFFFAAADRLEAHLRPAPQAEGDAVFVIRLRQAMAPPGGLVAFVSAGRPADVIWESALTRFAALDGPTWAEAVRRWTEAGGRMEVRQASIKAGDVTAAARNGVLSAGIDGRLRGRLPLQLNRPIQALGALGQSGGADPTAVSRATAVAQARGSAASLPLVFEAGVMTVGPVSLGEAPRVY